MAAGHAVSTARSDARNGYQTTSWQQMSFSRQTNPNINPAPVRALPNHSSEAA